MSEEKPIFKFAIRPDLKDATQTFVPTKAEPKATGWDVRAAFHDRQELVVKPGHYIKIPLGFRAFCPDGWWISLNPRSSTFYKKHLHCLVGTIDEQFPQEVCLVGQYIPDSKNINEVLSIKFCEPIGQIIPIKTIDMEVQIVSYDEYDELNKIRNGVRIGGFGSTSK